jgi:hypothetical protein
LFSPAWVEGVASLAIAGSGVLPYPRWPGASHIEARSVAPDHWRIRAVSLRQSIPETWGACGESSVNADTWCQY